MMWLDWSVSSSVAMELKFQFGFYMKGTYNEFVMHHIWSPYSNGFMLKKIFQIRFRPNNHTVHFTWNDPATQVHLELFIYIIFLLEM